MSVIVHQLHERPDAGLLLVSALYQRSQPAEVIIDVRIEAVRSQDCGFNALCIYFLLQIRILARLRYRIGKLLQDGLGGLGRRQNSVPSGVPVIDTLRERGRDLNWMGDGLVGTHGKSPESAVL